MAKSPLFGQNGLRKSAQGLPPDPEKYSKFSKKGRQDIYRVHQGNRWGLFINLVLPVQSFWQNVQSKMDSGNQPGHVPLILAKIQNLLKRVNRMFMKYIKVIIRDLLSISGYQVDYFVKKITFC